MPVGVPINALGSSMFAPILGSLRWLKAAPLWLWTAAVSFIQELIFVTPDGYPSAKGDAVSN